MPRTKPYTVIGIRRLKCFRCGNRGHASWQACADERIFRVLCLECDIALNELVLKWMGDPKTDEKMQRYRQKLEAGSDA